jgi:hypothetical protein
VVEAFSRMLKKACLEGKFTKLKISKGLVITHPLFVDDVVIFGTDSFEDYPVFKHNLDLFCQALGM